MAIKVIICLALGYIFGCFQTGYFYGKVFKGIDVRNYGSGNAGTTNTLRTLGKPAGYIVFLGDALKAVFAVWIVRYLLFPGLGDVTKILETVTALGVVLGHNYPFYMNFKGGKGIAATGGFMFALDVRIALIAAIVFAVVFFTTRYVSVGSLAISHQQSDHRHRRGARHHHYVRADAEHCAVAHHHYRRCKPLKLLRKM